MNAGGAGFLREPGDQLLDLLAHHHHQVGQLVDHNNNERQTLERFGLIRRQAEGVVDEFFALGGFVDFGVVAGQVAHTELAHQFIAALHFSHTPVQAVRGLAHVGDHGGEQVRNAFVDAHLEHLGVNQQQAHIARVGLVQEAQNHGVDAHRLARTGGAGHQTVRHFGQVGHHGVAAYVFAQADGQQRFGFVVDL